jgi:endogenous inhibitor of DNA gyrase (YacG/DUF329 family)
MPSPPNPCPICKKGVLPRAENSAFPFCSSRCKLVDLGQWLEGAYRVPTNEAPPDVPTDDSDRERS